MEPEYEEYKRSRKQKRRMIFLAVMTACLLLFWYGGVDYMQRGTVQLDAVLLSAAIAFIVAWFSSW